MTALDAWGAVLASLTAITTGSWTGCAIHCRAGYGLGHPGGARKCTMRAAPLSRRRSLSDYVMLHNNSAAGAQTLIHETGHMLGLAVINSYASQTYENGIRTFDMMCDNAGDHNGFSKWLLGWIIWGTLQVSASRGHDTDLTLSAISGNGASKIAVVSPTDSGMFSEYFLIQYDVPGLNNEGISYPGICPKEAGFSSLTRH